MSLGDEDFIADALKEYLIDNVNDDWENRAMLFLEMIVGIGDSADRLDYLSDKISSFGEIYLLQRKRDGETFSMIEASAYLDGAAREIAEIFVHTLENQSDLRAVLDPDPSPKGEPFLKYKIERKTEEIIKDLKDWIRN